MGDRSEYGETCVGVDRHAMRPWPTVPVQVQVLPHAQDLPLPAPATPGSAGIDLCAAIGADVALQRFTVQSIKTGLALALPTGYQAEVRARSGLARRHGLIVVNAPGTIDADYRGEIEVLLMLLGDAPLTLRRGDRIAQLVITPCVHPAFERVQTLPPSQRGSGGFGSTGSAAGEVRS